MKAMLVLEDGSSFEGVSAGVDGEVIGEVIMNTAVVGYQEIMTDPSNAGKIMTFTYPLIGNYGIAGKFNESRKCWVEAVVMKEKSRMRSNWQSEDTFDNFLKKENVVALNDADTRTLAVRIRDNGEMPGIISTKEIKQDRLLKKLADCQNNSKRDYIRNISVKKITEIPGDKSGAKIGVLDLGISNGFLKQLKTLGCNVILLPYNTDAEEILKLKLNGLIVSNGPEADDSIPKIITTAGKIIGKLPLLGISAGHEIICCALGGKLKKMKIGHRGVNYPVKSSGSSKGEITVQNHSFIVDEDSIKDKKDLKITLRNLNDNSIEEIESKTLKFISTQYYPASPGFDEVNGVFKRFLRIK